jgi:hypothetical protein
LCTQQTLLSADPKKKSSSIFLLFSMWSKNKKVQWVEKKQEREKKPGLLSLKCLVWFCVKDTDSAQREPPGRSAKMELSVRNIVSWKLGTLA